VLFLLKHLNLWDAMLRGIVIVSLHVILITTGFLFSTLPRPFRGKIFFIFWFLMLLPGVAWLLY
jgi:hypothetical protein